jgi:TonB family protein
MAGLRRDPCMMARSCPPVLAALIVSAFAHGLAGAVLASSDEPDERRRVVDKVASLLPQRVQTVVVAKVVHPVVAPAESPAARTELRPAAAPSMQQQALAASSPASPSVAPPARTLHARPAARPKPQLRQMASSEKAEPVDGPGQGIVAAPPRGDEGASDSGDKVAAATGDAPSHGGAAPSGGTGPATGPTSGATLVPGNARRALLARLSDGARRHLVYPRTARRLGLEGQTITAIRAGAEGGWRVAVHQSSGHTMLDEAACAAVERALADIDPGLEMFAVPAFVPVRFSLE